LIAARAFVKPFKVASPQENKNFDDVLPNEMHEVIGEARRKHERGEVEEDRDSFHPIFLCKCLAPRFYECGLDMFALSADFLVPTKWKRSTIIDLNDGRISTPLHGGMIYAVERDIVCGRLRARDFEAFDLAKAARG
jgi:hypothetical protein